MNEWVLMSFTKQNILCLCIGFILSFPAAAREKHLEIKVPRRVEEDLFGPVKKILTDDCHNMADEHTKVEENYDVAGNLLSQTNWDEEGKISYTLVNTYDENGCYTLMHSEDIEDGETNEWEIIINLSTRQMAKRNTRDGDFSIRTYSPSKYLMHFKKLDKKKKTLRSSRFKRRADNKETEYISYDERGRPKLTIKIKWNDKKLLDKEGIYNHKEKINFLNVYEYLKIDDHGNWLQRVKTTYRVEGSKKTKVSEHFAKRTIEYHSE